jgi:hypothetical protein
MFKHYLEYGTERISETLAQSWSYGKDLICLGITAITAHAEGLIQIDAEHGVRSFKAPHAI